MVAYVYLLCGVTIIFAESFDTIGRDIAAVQADGADRRAARLREAARAGSWRRGRRRPASEGRDLPAGRLARAWRSGAARSCADRPLAPLDRRCRRRWPIVWCSRRSANGARRPDPLPGLRQRAAGAERRRVLPRHRPADHRGLRPDRNRADPDRQSAGGAARRHRRQPLPASSCASPRTARSSRAARTSWPATTTSPRRPPTR